MALHVEPRGKDEAAGDAVVPSAQVGSTGDVATERTEVEEQLLGGFRAAVDSILESDATYDSAPRAARDASVAVDVSSGAAPVPVSTQHVNQA